MLVTISILVGALIGVLYARKRGGNKLDMAQHAAVFGLIFGIAALFVNVAMIRVM